MTLRFVAGLVSGLLFAGLSDSTWSATDATYHVRGLLRSFDPASHQATISHQEVPGYMSAMTMSFRVANDAEVRDLHPGDSLSFELHVNAGTAWIDRIRREYSTTPLPLNPPKTISAELNLGNRWPDAKLTDEEGAKIWLHDFNGRPVAITFIYLGCPLPTYCPLMNRNFQAAQALIQRLGCGNRVRLLSLSMDPLNDTPSRLAAVASGYEAKAPLWTFASVSEDELRPLAQAAGLEFSRTDGQVTHNLRTVVLDGEGRIRRIFRGNDWTPQELVAELRAALVNAP
jgi:protein SCO1/2